MTIYISIAKEDSMSNFDSKLCKEHEKRITETEQRVLSAQKQIDEMKQMTKSIYELSANIEHLTKSVDKSIESMRDHRLRLESVDKSGVERNRALEKRVDAIQMTVDSVVVLKAQKRTFREKALIGLLTAIAPAFLGLLAFVIYQAFRGYFGG